MKKAGFFLPLTLLLVAPQAFANESSVHITSDGNASATVNVQNSFNSSNSNSNTVDSHTKIRIETDGEVKEYESNSGDDIVMESSDGSSKVTIKNNGTAGITVTPGEEIEEITAKTTEEVKKEIDEVEKKQETLFEKIKEAVVNFIKNLF